MKRSPVRRWSALVVGAVIAVSVSAARADERVLTVHPDRTSVTFLLKATGHEVHGIFPVEPGELRVDLATGAASGTVTLNARGARTGNGTRDNEMHGSVLESERYPVIAFTPNRVEGSVQADAVSDVVVRGVVAIHGAEHPVAVPAKVRLAGDQLSADATFDVPYVEWGMRDPSVLFLRVAKVVSVTIKLASELRTASR